MSDTTTNTNTRFDSADAATASGDDRHVIATYLSDMLALERHIRGPLDRQVKDDDVAAFADAARIANRIRTLVDAHEEALQARLDALGGHAASGVKSAWSQVLGAGAAAISGSRKTKVSKGLRDDSTALGLATISYTMLHTTALGLGDAATAEIAKRHLEDYTPVVMEIGRTIPSIVLQELKDDGENVRISAAELAEQNARSAWHQAPSA